MSEPSRPDASSAPAAENASRKRRKPRRVQVSRLKTLSPAMRRITLTGPELQGFEAGDPASCIKLIFPAPDQTEPALPWPRGLRATTVRSYTPLAVRPDALEVDVDFVLHGKGPASTWAAQAQAGQTLLLMGPGPGYKLQAQAPEHLLVGDDSALPALETILACLPPSAHVRVLMEVAHAAEERALRSLAQLEVQWVVRGADSSFAGRALEAALRQTPPPATQTCVYLAGEATAVRRIRELLTDELGVARSQITGHGYWKLGKANYSDHDYGDDA